MMDLNAYNPLTRSGPYGNPIIGSVTRIDPEDKQRLTSRLSAYHMSLILHSKG